MVIQIGQFKLTGARAAVVLLLALGPGLAALIYYNRSIANWPCWISVAGWIAFSAHWSKAAKNSAAAKSSESMESRRMHELLTNLALVLLLFPIFGLRRSFLPPSMWWGPVGLAVQALFFALAVWARRHLGANWSGRIEIKTDHELVRTGPYRLLRHPIYTAMFGMYAGTAIAYGTVHCLVAIALLVFAYWRKIRMEEANMRQAFGLRYDDYRRATWGAFPGLF